MKSEKACDRILLAGNEGCRVLYCESCNVAELEIGALSLRLEVNAFQSLHELICESLQKISMVQQAKITQEQLISQLRKIS
ncbi:MAG: hypothetical protein ACAH07_09675 [Methylophilaceae bacterium]|jgi:hypothetical protein|nr:hypothetical protein [Methyloradius sp.]